MYEKQGTWLAMRTTKLAALIPEWSHSRHFLRVAKKEIKQEKMWGMAAHALSSQYLGGFGL